MAYGQFVAYEPAGKPGAYNFGLADGRSVSLFGPEAEDLRAKIDASNAAMPQATAKADPFAGTALALDGSDPVYGQGAAPSVPDAAGGPVQIPETAVQGQAPQQPQNVGFGVYRMPDGTLAERVGGRAAVTKEQNERQATQGTAMPVSASETVRGGFDPNQDFLEGMADVSIDERAAADQRMERDMVVAEQAAQVARDQQVQAMAQQAEAQRQALAAEVRVSRDQQIKDAAFKDYAEARIDPNRMFRGSDGTAKAIGAALSSGLGAFGAALTKTPNFAMQLIDSAIERDIRGQEAEIAVKRQAADNALTDLTKSGLTMEQSKGLLRQLQKEYAAKQAATLVAGNQIPEVMQRHQEWMTEHQKQRLMFEENYRQQSLGEATKAVASQVVYPQAGSAGGYRRMTPERAQNFAQGNKNLRKDDAPAGSATANAELDAAQGSVEVIDQTLKKYDQNAVPKTPETRNVLERSWHALQDFVGGEGTAASNMSPQDRGMIQDVETAKQQVMAIHSVLSKQGAMSESQAAAAEKAIQSARTVGEVRRAAAGLAERVRGIRGARGQ